MFFKLTTFIILLTSLHLIQASALPADSTDTNYLPLEERASANLAWGPYYVGDLKLYITNPHFGAVGPKFPGGAPHINAHVDRKRSGKPYKAVVNLHVVKYTHAKQQCLYMWDSVSKKTVFDKCFGDWEDAAKEAVETAKNVVDGVMEGIETLAKIAATIALGVALIAAILLSGLNPAAA